jgi:hypothetical protein
MALDTNILIDYAEFGDLMWAEDHEFDPPISEPHYLEELVVLSTFAVFGPWSADLAGSSSSARWPSGQVR